MTDLFASDRNPLRRRDYLLRRKALLFLWLCFILRGCFYSAILPLWEGYDEPYHFSFIQYLAAHHELPSSTTPVSHEVQASLHLVPLSWEQRLHVLEPPIYSEEFYWQMPESARANLQQQLRALPPVWGTQSGTAPTMYEAQQGPLYYWIMSHLLPEEWTLPARVLLIRLLSVLLASLVVPIAYLAGLRFFDTRAPALGVVAVLVCMPELMIDISRAGNESLALLLYSLLTVLLLYATGAERPKLFAAAGVVLGLGLLSKAYFLAAVPAFLLLAAYSAWGAQLARMRILINAAIGLAAAALIGGGWYWRNHALTGTWSGEENNVAAMQQGLDHVLSAAAHVNWAGGVTSVLVSHIWFGGWSFLKLPRPVYAVFAFGIALAAVGLARRVFEDRFRSAKFVALLAVYAFFWLGLLYNILLVYVATGVSASDGWYMYAVVLAEVLLATWGLYALVPAELRPPILPAVAGAFAAIDLYGAFALMVPYYTGVIAHVPGGDEIHPANLSQLVHTPAALVLSRLTVNKPEWLSPAVFAVLMVLYVAATIVAVMIAGFALRRPRLMPWEKDPAAEASWQAASRSGRAYR